VSALNWRRWHGFRQSLAASFRAVCVTYLMLALATVCIVLVASAQGGLVLFLSGLVGVTYYFVFGFPLAALLACAGGAVLYGLFVVMRYAAGSGRARSERNELKPRPPAFVSL
jgi:hypothetical protein